MRSQSSVVGYRSMSSEVEKRTPGKLGFLLYEALQVRVSIAPELLEDVPEVRKLISAKIREYTVELLENISSRYRAKAQEYAVKSAMYKQLALTAEEIPGLFEEHRFAIGGSVRKKEPIDQEIEAFERLKEVLLKEHEGKYVAIYGGKVVDSDEDDKKLARRVYRRYGLEPILIRKVTREAPKPELLPGPRRLA